MLKQNQGYHRANGKKMAMKTFIFAAAISVIAGFVTMGLSMNKSNTQSNLIVTEYSQTQEYQDALTEDYKKVLDVAEEKGLNETKDSIQKLDSQEYRIEKLLSSKNNMYFEKYNENKKQAKNLGVATACLFGAAAVTGTIAKHLQDELEEKGEI